MKKLIGTAMLAALLATSAFAEVSFSAWLRTMVLPVAGDGDKILTGWTNSWGWGVRTARMNTAWTSEDEKVGMLFDLYADNFEIGVGDYAAGWLQPADWVKFMIGKIDNGYTMRSDVTYGSWAWIRPKNWVQDDEGITFELGTMNAGLQVELFPVEGLQILARLPLPVDTNDRYVKMIAEKDYTDDDKEVVSADKDGNTSVVSVSNGNKTYGEAYKWYGKGTVAVGYTISDIGTVKAAFLGNYSDGVYGKVNVAFDLTAIENMFLTVGVRIPVEDKISSGEPVVLPSLGFSYQILDNFRIALTAAADLKKSVDPTISAGVGIDFGLTDTLGLVADFRYKGDLDTNKSYISFLVGLDYNFSSNGVLGIGFQGTTNGTGFLSNQGASAFKPYKADSFCWAVPIKFQYGF